MEKGKVKSENSDLSIMVVPHFSKRFKVFEFRTHVGKLIFLTFLAISSMIVVSGLAIITSRQNVKLSSRIEKLTDITMQQRELITDKSSEIQDLKEAGEESQQVIQDFAIKYKEITDKYITSKTNRSGDRTDSNAFIEDISGLKELLNKMSDFKTKEQDSVTGLEETESKLKAYMDAMPTQWPSNGRISSKYGDRQDPLIYGTRFHSGLDLATSTGQSITAAGKGKVTYSGYNGDYGYCIIMDHGYGISSVYGHASKLLVKVGQEVNKGDEIAKVGSTGRSTGPHLHFEIRLDDKTVDPMSFLGK